ncbi:MAG: NAD-dependent epimerase/dehydratase family protein [Vitreoscilla sp.]
MPSVRTERRIGSFIDDDYMAKKILIIGGTRFFGRRLVQRLLDAGEHVTLATRGQTRDDFGDRVRRIAVDRRDARALRNATRGLDFDVVFDQVCYTPLDARTAADLFAGRAGRYVMASTIEVYRPLVGIESGPFKEGALALTDKDALDGDSRWRDPAWAEPRYGEGKRRAEAVFERDGRLAFVAVRIGHVLGGPEDFTGRLAAHVQAARAGRPLAQADSVRGASSFISPEDISLLLQWTAVQEFIGPVNAASQGGLDAAALHRRVLQALSLPAPAAAAGEFASPFDYPAPFEMDMSRASALGHRFRPVDAWLPDTIRAHVEAVAS